MSTPAPHATWVPEWTIADRLRKIRRDRHMSQDAFAELLEVRPATYSAWETGRNTPDRLVPLARRVEEVTGVPAAWTLGVHEEGPRPGGPDGGLSLVRHQGLEPRTRWFGRSGERRGYMPIAVPGQRPPRRDVVVPLAAGLSTWASTPFSVVVEDQADDTAAVAA